ncbi:MAG: copper transporter [Nitrospiraceae bacterium]|nr:MAG: copper transporter [Nitrospiraceae bacterium]
MIIDFKYHVASLIAVFFALGIGILVGSAVLGNNVNDVILQQQKQLVDNLKRDFDQMRKENKAAQDEIADYQATLNISKQFEKQVLPIFTEGKLNDKKIAVIETSNYGFHEDWINTLKSAGAEIISITTVLEGFNFKNDEVRKSLSTKLMLNETTEPAVLREVAKEIAEGVISAQNIENLHYFEQLGLIKTSGNYGGPVNAVIFVGGSREDVGEHVSNFDLPMMSYFLSKNIPVFGVETSDVDYSYMKHYQKLKVSTVDNIEMTSGQLSLVMAISGKPGNYGIKTTARQLLPVIP